MIAMESSTILTADVLDILFEGRNKEYGAYDLRKTYNRRLTVSITVMLSLICMFFIGFAFAGKKSKVDPALLAMKDIELASVKPQEKPAEPPPPPLKQPPPPVQVQTLRVTPPRIVPDEQVTKDEMPPVEEQEHVKIGTENRDGVPEGDVVAPPIDGSATGVIEAPKKDDAKEDGIFISVQIESEYPGGPTAWRRVLDRSLRYPNEAADQGIQGFVTVQFVVDKEGNVSDVEAVSGPEELRAEAVRVIKKSGKWTPAIQNGNKVKSYKRQPIGFKLNDE
jgi:protein TonB